MLALCLRLAARPWRCRPSGGGGWRLISRHGERLTSQRRCSGGLKQRRRHLPNLSVRRVCKCFKRKRTGAPREAYPQTAHSQRHARLCAHACSGFRFCVWGNLPRMKLNFLTRVSNFVADPRQLPQKRPVQFKHPQRLLALAMVSIYQRWISPRKGFRCAYAASTGEASCSQFCKEAIMQQGLREGLRRLRIRFQQCHQAASMLESTAAPAYAMAADSKKRKARKVDGKACPPHTVHNKSGCNPWSRDKVLTNDCKPCDSGKIGREDRCGCGTFKTSRKARWRDKR